MNAIERGVAALCQVVLWISTSVIFVILVANTILRNFGLTLFLAGVGMSSGEPFVSNIAQDGLPLLLAGVIQVAVVVLIVIFGGWFVLRMKYDDLLGIASGATGNPAILAYGNQLTPTGRPDMGYAMIFPGVGTILKIVLVQVMLGTEAGVDVDAQPSPD